MGGMYHPIAQGEIDGDNCGLKSDLSIYWFVQNSNFNYEKFRSDYWIGFGSGYRDGQTLRNSLKKLTGILSFEDYISCTEYLFHKTRIYQISPQDYLDNIDNWSKLTIEYNVCQISLSYLIENKIQRGLNELFEFYYANFRLKGLQDLDILYQELKNLRNRKKKENNYNTLKDKKKIIFELKSMINKHREHKN